MKQLVKTGCILFSIGMIALGLLSVISKDFIIGRPPAWSENFSMSPALAYVAGMAIVIAAICILMNIQARIAAFLIVALILLLSVSRHLFHFMSDWLNTYKTLALCGGALIVASAFSRTNNDGSGADRKVNNVLVIIGSVFISVFFIASGYAHFKFADFVNGFIPAYIPFHPFWTYFCGICLVAGGAGILIPRINKWVALLSGIMVAGWFVLLHIPRFLANTSDVSDRMGLCESFTIAGILFVLAGLLFAKQNGSHAPR